MHFSFQSKAEYIKLEELKIIGNDKNRIEQRPLIAFSPHIIDIAQKQLNGIQDTYQKVKILYDYLTTNFRYSYVRSYTTIDCVADLCAKRRAGDCGSLAMLLTSLYRYIGIPTRMVGGLQIQKSGSCEYKVYSHDWLEICVSDKGWIPIDPFMGVVAKQYENEEARQFFWGNIDPLRIVSCLNNFVNFNPKELSMCLDPFDNQIGEVFCENKSLQYNEVYRQFCVKSVQKI